MYLKNARRTNQHTYLLPSGSPKLYHGKIISKKGDLLVLLQISNKNGNAVEKKTNFQIAESHGVLLLFI